MSMMIPTRSMTGYGQARGQAEGQTVAVELRSVNHRQLRLNLKLPQALQSLETEVEASIKARVLRGTIQASVRLERESALPPVGLSVEALKAFSEATDQAAAALGWPPLPPERRFDLFLRLPGVLTADSEPDQALGEALRPLVLRTLSEALDALEASRSAEGASLAEALDQSLRRFEDAFGRVRERAPQVAPELLARAKDRVAKLLEQLGTEGSVRPDDWARELCLLSDRTDVQEEVDRLVHHTEEFRKVLQSGSEVGRRLDFLCQELLRETNTIGSKANDVAMTGAVIDMKIEIERLKEQVQNLE